MSTRKPPGRAGPKSIYQLRIDLRHIEPRIWRTILVPDTLTLAKLDRVVQAAMGWTNSHLHDWDIGGKRYGIPDPEWDNEGDMLDERKFTAGAVLGQDIEEFGYQYDFGDGWEHRLIVEKRAAPQPHYNTWPMCIAGANACPPEDVGGPPGYMDFIQAVRTPTHEEHRRMWQWNGGPFDPTAFSVNEANRAIRRLR
ncbi:MAG: plasmid pRiA4b ORF-3 family protein [Burkholderiales bacterium]|nr:plasmid pRiA4b ORF-3 family protein [Burkholderiales bacterium]